MKYHKDGRVRVMMPAVGVAALTEHLSTAKSYLEYGSGGSTILAVELGVSVITAVETCKPFLDEVVAKANSMPYSGTFNPIWVDVGPTGNCGRPTDMSFKDQWPVYQDVGWNLGISPDVILVDGRFRVSSFCTSFLNATPGTTVLFDDYVPRPQYYVVEKIAKPIATHGRMLEFVVPETFDRELCTKIRDKYLLKYT